MRGLHIDWERTGVPKLLVGTGGIGGGLIFAVDGHETLGRNESRGGRFLDNKDYCKLHIIAHYIAVMLNAGNEFRVVPVGKIGQDDVGRQLHQMMTSTGMEMHHVQEMPGVNTMMSVCFQYPDASGGNLTTIDSASSHVSATDIEEMRPLFEEYRDNGIVLAAPEVPLDARIRMLEMGKECGFFCTASITCGEVSDALDRGMISSVDLLAVNHEEAAAITGVPWQPETPTAVLDACSDKLVAMNPDIHISVTVGKDGAWGFSRGRWEHSPGVPVTPVNTAGAGDAHMAGLIIGYVAGLPFISEQEYRDRESLAVLPISTAMDFGVLMASLSVTSKDTIHDAVDAQLIINHARRWDLQLSEEMKQLLGG